MSSGIRHDDLRRSLSRRSSRMNIGVCMLDLSDAGQVLVSANDLEEESMSTVFRVLADDDSPLDARLEIEDAEVVLHSRSGNSGGSPRNPDYASTLRLLLRRFAAADLAIETAWVDSNRVQNVPHSERVIFSAADSNVTPDDSFTLMATRMRLVGQASNTTSHGNSTKRIRIRLAGSPPAQTIIETVRAVPFSNDSRSRERLPAEKLYTVTAEQVWAAVQKLLGGFSQHSFGPSTDYDLLADDGTRLPPKAVFGIAASEALGCEVLPKHFTGGMGSPCFQVLTRAGYRIVPKTQALPNDPPVSGDLEWTEGRPKLVQHVKKERGKGLARAKKAQFKRLHDGKLFCERCGIDPVVTYETTHGEACIEVHHHAVQVKDMDDGHNTKLEDLQCLCANCHRLVHRLLRIKIYA